MVPVRYLSKADIARLLGVSRAMMGYYHLPEPDVYVGRSSGWSREKIEKWIKEERCGRHRDKNPLIG